MHQRKPSASVPQPTLDQHKVSLTFFDDKFAAVQYRDSLTLPQLADEIRFMTDSKKTKLPWLKLALFGEQPSARNCLRTNENLRTVTGVEVDYDAGETSFDQAVERLAAAGLRSLVYTSASHKPGVREKWRVLCPLSTPTAAGYRVQLVAWLNGVLGGGIDPASFNLSIAFYYGSVNDNPDHRVEVLDGDFIDLRPDLAAGAIGKGAAVKRETLPINQNPLPINGESPAYSDADIDAMLDRSQYGNSDGSGNWHPTMVSVTAALVGRGLGDAAIRERTAPFADGGAHDEDVQKLIDGARAKWGIPDPDVPPGARLGPEVLAAIAADAPAAEPPSGSQLDDYYAFLPTHQYIYRHTGRLYPLASINATLDKVTVGAKKKKQTKKQIAAGDKPEVVAVQIPASLWLDRNRPVMEMSWLPGGGELIEGRLPAEGGWVDKAGVQTFNEYRPPVAGRGDPAKAGRWLELVRRIYPGDFDHIVAFFAHRLQRPAEKINHALVLTGSPGIGKDTMLEPLKRGVGAWNFKEISPQDVTSNNNDFMKSVVLRVSETRDLGEINRYAFYEATKTMTAAPPDMVRVNIKHVPQFYVPNITAVIFTTNYPADGLYLSPDDRRHYVCGTELARSDAWDSYCLDLWGWYQAGGLDDVVAYLAAYDLAGFNAKLPPKKTDAFWRMVDAGRPAEEGEFRDAIAKMSGTDENGHPNLPPVVLTLDGLTPHANPELVMWIRDRNNTRNVGRRLDECGYIPVRNSDEQSGRWKLGGARKTIFGRKDVSLDKRYAAAVELKRRSDEAHARVSEEIGKLTPQRPRSPPRK
jgi:hypothetical protein